MKNSSLNRTDVQGTWSSLITKNINLDTYMKLVELMGKKLKLTKVDPECLDSDRTFVFNGETYIMHGFGGCGFGYDIFKYDSSGAFNRGKSLVCGARSIKHAKQCFINQATKDRFYGE